jgi:hypothetical protein
MRAPAPARVAGIVLRALLAAAVVAVLAPPAREVLLRAAIPRAGAALPAGRLEVDAARWPRLGRVELDGVRWVVDADGDADGHLGAASPADTLASAERIVAAVRLAALLRRELDAELLAVDSLALDLPAVRSRLPERPEEPDEDGTGGAPAPPSLAVEAFRLNGRVLLEPGAPPARVAVAGALELRRGRAPALNLESIEIRDDARGIALGPGSLRIDPAAGVGSGEVAGRWGDAAAFALSARSRDADRMTVELAGASPDSGAGFRADATFDRRDGGLPAIHLDVELRLPTTARLVALTGAEGLRRLPPDERLQARVRGTWEPPSGEGAFQVECGPYAGWDSLSAGVTFAPGEWAATGIRLAAPGLAAEGEWKGARGRMQGDLRAVVDGTDWMGAFVPRESRPESLRVTLDLTAEGAAAALQGTVRAEGGVAAGGVRVDSVRVRLDGALTGSGAAAFEVSGLTSGVWLAASGAVTARDPLRFALAPVRVTARRDSAGGRHSGRLTIDPAAGVTAEQVRVDGDYGALRVDARADTAGAWSATASFRIPVPADAASSPAAAKLTPLEGTVRAEGRDGALTARLDAGATAWLDEARGVLRMGPAGRTLDTLVVRGLGATVQGAARATAGDSLEGTLRVDLAGLDGLRAFVPAMPESVSAEAAGDVTLSGTVAAPGVHARIAASARGPSWDVPGALAEIDLRGGAIASASLRATDTVRAGGLAVHKLAVQARPVTAGAPLPLFLSVEAEADSAAALVVAEVEAGDSTVARVDTLAVRWGDRDLRSGHPFAARWEAATGAWSVRALELRGSLGHVIADGGAGPDSATFRAEIALEDPPRPPGVEATAWPSPARIEATARLVSRDSLEVGAAARGMKVGTLGQYDLRADARAGNGGTVADVQLLQGETAPLSAHVLIPRRIDAAQRVAVDTEGRWSARVSVTDLPVPVRPSELAAAQGLSAAKLETTAEVSGTVDVLERDGRVSGSASLTVAFPGLASLREDRVQVVASLAGAGAAGDSLPGLRAELRWLHAGSATATVDAALPGATAGAERFRFLPGEELRAGAAMDEWRLADLDALLPPGMQVDGTLSSRLGAEGPLRDPLLRGWFQAKDVVVSTARGDRARAQGRLDFSGSAQAPEVAGRLEVTQARLLIPEPPRELHDADGHALLWPADSTAAAADTVDVPVPAPVEALDLGIAVTIPGSCWIRGRGLDVELAGDLSLVLNRGQPRVDGQLHAVRGTFSFLGSSFEVDRGVATFYGTESIDPDLDLMLSRRKGDVKAIVRVTGRTTAPAIALSSEPPMEEADVASYLLFGRASTDLDREQTGLLQSQASAALQLYAMPGLQRELGQRLGLDVVQVRQRDDATEQMSVVVGKYLSPRALLKYDQGLDRTDDFTIDLEYWLTRHLRVETTTSRQNQSGVILNWSADY